MFQDPFAHGMSPGCSPTKRYAASRHRGQVVVAPGDGRRFAIFDNSTALAQAAAESRDPSRLPSFMVTLPFREFSDRLRVRVRY